MTLPQVTLKQKNLKVQVRDIRKPYRTRVTVNKNYKTVVFMPEPDACVQD